jgi:hypothetical protein
MTLGADPVTVPPAKFRQGKAQEIIAEVLKTKVSSCSTPPSASTRGVRVCAACVTIATSPPSCRVLGFCCFSLRTRTLTGAWR